MPRKLDSRDPGFEAAFTALLGEKREADADVNAQVAAILADVRTRGDAAVLDYTARFDRVEFTADELRLTPQQVAEEAAKADAEAVAALELAASRIRAFHERQTPKDERFTDAAGVELGYRWTAIAAAGLYVPGGLAAYPSSVLMNAVPAKVAGVPRIVMTVPAPDGVLNPLVLAAAQIAGVDEVYRVGGAQAIAAMAYGTATIAPVDTIVGPGNAYVAAAKRQVFGTVGIDMIAGPSEILVLADGQNDPVWIAADLLSQAEHDTSAQAILITDDAAFAGKVAAAVEDHLASLPRHDIPRESWDKFGAIIIVPDLADAPALVDRLAPEHLEIATADPDDLAGMIRNAGAIFLGRHTPEAIGDYIAGPNHVLPTARSARYASGLSVLDFVKRTSLIRCNDAALANIGPAAVTLAEAEGLPAHARSIAVRLSPQG
jgi:histidinol dehydrogenase